MYYSNTYKQMTEKMKTSDKTTAFGSLLPPSLAVPQYSNPTISRLIAESMSKPQSPLTPSPTGAAEVRSILQRLEHIEIESRELLTKLFSMVQTDARLERYIRKWLEDPKVSGMWELVEQILDAQPCNSEDYANKGVSLNDDEGSMRMERFKVRVFDLQDDVDVPYPPQPSTTNHK